MSMLVRCLVLTLLGLAVVGLSPVYAEDQATALKLNEPTRMSTRGQLALSATLTTPAGKPVGDREIDFYQTVEFFGSREAHLGTATTDSTGVAVLVYQPALRGQQTLIARAAAGQGYAASSATATIQVREVEPTFEEEPLPLAPLRQLLPLGLSAVVAIVWLILLGSLATAVLRIRGAARPPQGGLRAPAGPSPASGVSQEDL